MPKIGLFLPQKAVLGLPNGRNHHLEALFSILFVEHFYANISSFDAKISIGAQGFELENGIGVTYEVSDLPNR